MPLAWTLSTGPAAPPLQLRNDVVGLLAEEYDVEAGRQVGNFPQAFSHVSLVNTANNLSQLTGPARRRPGPD